METPKKHNKIIVILVVLIIVVSIFLLRNKILKNPADNKPNIIESPVVSDSIKDQINTNTDNQPIKKSSDDKQAIPVYTGRDQGEINPSAKAMSDLPEEYRNQVYDQIKVFGRTVKDNPQYVSGWLQLGILKKTIGDYIGARDAWEYASKIDGQQQYIVFQDLGDLYWQYLPDLATSEKDFKRSIELKSDNIPAYISLVQLYEYSYKEKSGQVIGVLQKGIAENPKSVDLTKTLADYYQRHNMLSQALDWWQKSLNLDPASVDIQQNIDDVEKNLK